jgi:hypothetical protein
MKTKTRQTSPKWLIALLACMFSCLLIWVASLLLYDDTDRLTDHVQAACIATASDWKTCNAEYAVSLYHDEMQVCEQTVGTIEPFDANTYADCLARIGIVFN